MQDPKCEPPPPGNLPSRESDTAPGSSQQPPMIHRHLPGAAHEALGPRPQARVVGAPARAQRTRVEQGRGDLALADSGGERIMGTQQENPAPGPGFRRVQGFREIAGPPQPQQPSQRQKRSFGCLETVQTIAQADRATDHASLDHIEPKGAKAIGDQRVLAPARAGENGRAFAKPVELKDIGGRFGRMRRDGQDEGMDIASPDRPGGQA